jgi:hypothetical protein
VVTILQQALSPEKHTTAASTRPLRSQTLPRWSRGAKRPVPCQANSSAYPRTANRPAHLALRCLVVGHPGSVPTSTRGLPLPLRFCRQVHQLGGGEAYASNTGQVMHVKCIHDLCTLPLDIPPYMHHILVIFMLFDDYN